MVPKARSVFHRVVSMGLWVAYKAFIGNDTSFLEPIHTLSGIDVDVATQVSDGEEGVFNNHFVGNVPEMDPHVLEVGHPFVELVVDDFCGHAAGPFMGVRDDGVDMNLEDQ